MSGGALSGTAGTADRLNRAGHGVPCAVRALRSPGTAPSVLCALWALRRLCSAPLRRCALRVLRTLLYI